MALLMFITFVWAVAALASRARWCLIIFAVMAFLSLTYLALSVLVPRASAAGSHHRHIDEIAIPPKRQAM
jgi:hypothetical protein